MPPDAPILTVSALSKQFRGVLAVSDVSFSVTPGEIMGLIGPNGAGKTTTFNLISGRFPSTGGEISIAGRRVNGLRPDRIAALGVARTFQGTRVFPKLTAEENIRTALLSRESVGFWEDWLNLPRARRVQADARAKALDVLAFVGLSDQRDTAAGSLPYAYQSLLGIGLAMARQPRLLLLDEPFAGMNPRETMDAAQMVRRIRDRGVTVLLVEHDMAAVMGVCDRIVVLDHGCKIAEGTPAEIRSNRAVIEAYLGTDDDDA
jgi:branched-chain amino acid transport system ATP-binding protein